MSLSSSRASSRTDFHSTESPRHRSTRGSADKTCGSSVEPGTPVSKAQKDARKDSRLDTLAFDGKPAPVTQTTRDSFAELAKKMRLDNPQLDVFDLDASMHTADDSDKRRPPGNLRPLIVSAIVFLLAFGLVYVLVEYLLSATRALATCTPSTVYIPVTRFASSSGTAPDMDGNSTTEVTVYSTATALETMTSYVTLQPAVVATGLTSSGSPSYYFTMNSAGSTDWLNGVSPPATASLTVITRSFFVTPVMQTASDSTTTATITSTATVLETITLPAYTSTTYSLVKPQTTVTSTSTHYVTHTVSQASEDPSNAETTLPRTSYSSPGPSGWNASTAGEQSPTGVAAAAAADPQLTTLSEIHYFGDGDKTTSTTTKLITTSIQVAYTTTLMPSVPASGNDGELVTTLTALPVTLTYSDGEGYSTSIAFTTSVLPAIASSANDTTSSFPTAPSLSSHSLGTVASLSPVVPHGSSTGAFTNSTSAATVSAASYSAAVSATTSARSAVPTANSSTAGAATGNQPSSSSVLGSSTPTAPDLISTAISIATTSSSSKRSDISTIRISSSLATASAASSASGVPSPSYNTNVTAAGAPTKSATTSSASQSLASVSTTSSAAYGETSMQSVPSSQASEASVSSSPPASSPATSNPEAPASPIPISSTSSPSWSTSTRFSTSSSSTMATTSSSPSVSQAAPSLNATAFTASSSTGSASQEGSPSSGAPSTVLSSSQTTASVTGVPASATSAMPTTGCGEYGDFDLDFDNLPNFSPSGESQTDITQAPPIPNPYHHFTFNEGYVYAPDPKVPYEPVSPPHVAVFVGNGTGMRATQTGKHTIEDGEFADGPYESSSAFWFDAFSGWFGCDNEGPEVCTLVMSAYTYDAEKDDEVLASQKNATVEGCPGFKDCKLKKIDFPEDFKGLSGLQIRAFTGQEERMFFMDSLSMKWSDNSCAAGLTRQRSR